MSLGKSIFLVEKIINNSRDLSAFAECWQEESSMGAVDWDHRFVGLVTSLLVFFFIFFSWLAWLIDFSHHLGAVSKEASTQTSVTYPFVGTSHPSMDDLFASQLFFCMLGF